jgi:RHS repeat-associated protein
MTYPSGRVITYNYSNDRATNVLNGAATIVTNISYKPFGGMTSITYGNGIDSTVGYDTQYHLSTIVTSTFQNLTYGYDYNGNITSIAPGKTFTYDALDRLATGTGTWGSLSWTYDGVGNRLTENTTGYTYTANSNKLNTVGGLSYGYDNNGNTTSEGSRLYTHNQNQRMIQAVNGTTTANYTYNGNGQRVKKVVNGTTTIFHYTLNGQIIAESNSAGNIVAEYVYLNGQPLAKIEGANTYYYHNDHLATPQKMTDGSGQIIWSADYKPFGEATITVSTVTNNLRFPGQYFDAETGLHYNYFRDYNPALGRYPEADRIGQRGGINLYSYVGNNPVIYSDSRGLLAAPWHFGLSLLAGLESGMGIGGSLNFAWNSMAVDFAPGSQGFDAAATAQHGMAGVLPSGRPQSPQEAINAAKDFIQSNRNCGNLAKAAHAAQDLATPVHAGQPWTGFGLNWNTVFHIIVDISPLPITVWQAYQNTLGVLK